MKLVLFLLFTISAFAAINVKHLAGAPEEFSLHSIPDPRNTISSERSYTENIWFEATQDSDVVYERSFPVDGPKDFVFTFASPHSDNLDLQMYDPNGHQLDLKSVALQTYWPLGDVKLPMTAYVIQNSAKGLYKLVITSTMAKETITELGNSLNPNAALTLINNDLLEIRSHMSNYIVRAGSPIGIVSTIVDSSTESLPEGLVITEAKLDITTPTGADIELPMTDNEAFLGAPPQSGFYGAQIDAQSAGDYVLLTRMKGTIQDAALGQEVAFERTTQHLVQVSAATVDLDGTARLTKTSKAQRVSIDIRVQNADGPQPMLRGYAEVWGIHEESKQLVPVCWIGGLVPIMDSYASLELDLNWLQRAGVSGQLTLRNTYLADIDTSFPVTRYDNDIVVSNSDSLITIKPELLNMDVTEEMSFGVRPAGFLNVTQASDVALLLVHGYCANTNPWETNPSDFTNAYYPLWSLANDSHDQFSKKVMSFSEQKGISGFALIGHSQGGTVGAHLRNFYWSGLDNLPSGGRIIQSVGTPYRGCTGAGSAANLIKIFGVGCGANADLTVDASVNWLAGIAAIVRKDIAYYTTTYQQGNFFGDYCNMAVNLLLGWPNDGVTELDYAMLSGGVYMGNTQKQCHTTDMSYVAQYNDRARNQAMNKAAAR